MPGSPAGDDASRFMIRAATAPGGPSVTRLFSTIEPPAAALSELNHTVVPSYWAPMVTMWVFMLVAWVMRPSHVLAGTFTLSLRYQSSWVLVFAGAAHSCPLYVAVASGPGS